MNNIVLLLILFSPGLMSSINPDRSSQPPLEVLGGFDGANPQSEDSIIKETPDRFRIKPFNEEGSNFNYYFRFNTKVINNTSEPQGIELIIEWPPLKEHPNFPYDNYYYGDMGNWQWTYANIKDSDARLHITVPPGTTYVGFYPRYSYEHHEQFMTKLNEDKYVKKYVAGKSYYDRDIWCVKVTDPDVPDTKKSTLLITSRDHPYETGGSYISEEMIKFLASNETGRSNLIKNNIIYIVPMLNPDGVALGLNNQTRPNGGVDISFSVYSDDPSATTLLNLVKKIRPKIWADIHSWPHHGDDGMLSTHEWLAEGLLEQMPDGTFNDYVWNVSFVKDRNKGHNHLWEWLMRTYDSGGVSLSMSWYRRNEKDIREIGIDIIKALGVVNVNHSRNSK